MFPEILTSCAILAMWLHVILGRENNAFFITKFAAFLLFVAAGFAAISLSFEVNILYQSYRIDFLSQMSKLALCIVGGILILQTRDRSKTPDYREYMILIMTSLLGLMTLTSSNDFIAILVSIELSSFPLYILTAFKKRKVDAEAAIKFMLFGGLVTAGFLYGLSLFYGLVHGTSLSLLPNMVMIASTSPVGILTLILLFLPIAFKLTAVPFHFWAPDTYQVTENRLTAFLATVSKLGFVVLLVRMSMHIVGLSGAWQVWILGIAILSMFIGNACALLQKDLKRLFAYSSIAQAGYILLGVAAPQTAANQMIFFYGLAYIVMNLSVFYVILKISDDTQNENPTVVHLSGLCYRSPFLAFLLLLSVLSLAGVPPLAGFTGKWFLFAEALRSIHYVWILIAVVNSVISLYYYLSLVKMCYLEPAYQSRTISLGFREIAFILALIVILLGLGIYPQPLFARLFP